MRTAWILLSAALLSLSPLQAGGEFEFAVPDDGRITLGVFDGSGKLVRLLHRLAKQEDFRIGDNGLITSWDGKNDAGVRVAPGHYYVRGYLIGGDVRVSGENFLFNDWAADPGFPGFGRIKDFCLLENGDVILLAGSASHGISTGETTAGPSPTLVSAGNQSAQTPQRLPDRAEGIRFPVPGIVAGSGDWLARFSPDKGFLWSRRIDLKILDLRIPGSLATPNPAWEPLRGSALPFPPQAPQSSSPPLLATNASLAMVMTQEGVGVYSLDAGQEKNGWPREPGVAPLALAANDSKVFISFSGGLLENTLPDLSQEKTDILPPPYAFAMDADSSTLIGASPDGVWVRQESLKRVALPTSVKSVALGMPGTFWFVGIEKETPFVAQASFSGEILRALRPAAEDPKPEKIRALRRVEKFAVTESLPGLQRLRVMARTGTGEWTIEWERTFCESARFGFVDGKPAADAGSAAQEKSLRFRLKENPLTGKRDFLTLRAESGPDGSRLVSPDGLPLVEVSSRRELHRTAIHRGDKPDSLRFLQGNGSFVEEFSISGLDDILPLDAGSIDIP